SSGIRLEMSAHSPDAIAQLLKTADALNLQAGTLIVNPVPAEDEIPADEMETFIHKALIMSHEQGVSGKETTPFLLKQVAELTAGRSLLTNKALVRNNVKLGAEVAAAYSSAE
ncbi:MAG: pseudouridine-5-phosphate glycosidase, partial [Bacteroidota bacterium]